MGIKSLENFRLRHLSLVFSYCLFKIIHQQCNKFNKNKALSIAHYLWSWEPNHTLAISKPFQVEESKEASQRMYRGIKNETQRKSNLFRLFPYPSFPIGTQIFPSSIKNIHNTWSWISTESLQRRQRTSPHQELELSMDPFSCLNRIISYTPSSAMHLFFLIHSFTRTII